MAAYKGVFTQTAFTGAQHDATAGGTRQATHQAEERHQQGHGLNPLVDPKGLPHLGVGPIRLSLPRFEMDEDSGYWRLACDIPIVEETLLDTTGSMRDNVDMAFHVLPDHYDLLTAGDTPVLGRYDVQIINACFGDIEDRGTPILCRTQAEMDVKIAQQIAMMVPSRDGQGNGKEDPQFGIFAAAYLTKARINAYGLKRYHFTISDEPIFETIDYGWLKKIFGDDVLKWVTENGHEMSEKRLPSVSKVVKDLQREAHAFFLQVNSRGGVRDQWTRLYGAEYVVSLPEGTQYLHYVKACIIGLTEGVLDLQSAEKFLRSHKLSANESKRIVSAVAHIPLGAQMQFENFNKLPKIGDLFKEKTDLWPVEEAKKLKGKGKPKDGPKWL